MAESSLRGRPLIFLVVTLSAWIGLRAVQHSSQEPTSQLADVTDETESKTLEFLSPAVEFFPITKSPNHTAFFSPSIPGRQGASLPFCNNRYGSRRLKVKGASKGPPPLHPLLNGRLAPFP
jgi:hypothetical protein